MTVTAGTLPEREAFVFIQSHPKATLGSAKKDGTRRIVCDEKDLPELQSDLLAFSDQAAPSARHLIYHGTDNGLGDTIKKAIEFFGITEEAVSRWLGAPCNCSERAAKLNALGAWATEAVKSGISSAMDFFKTTTK